MFDSLLSAVVVEAKRPIRQGEELLIDYGDDYDWGGKTPTPPPPVAAGANDLHAKSI